MMPLTDILKNKLLLQKKFGTQEISMDKWPFWMLEENIKIGNQILEDIENPPPSGDFLNNPPKR